jgi:CRISPR/Cas system-associated exonuclease Cas4 (RecB family)
MKSGEIDFIQKNEDSFEKHSIVVSTEDLGNLKLIIQDTYKKIQAHDFQMTNDLDNCSACSFKNVCGR